MRFAPAGLAACLALASAAIPAHGEPLPGWVAESTGAWLEGAMADAEYLELVAGAAASGALPGPPAGDPARGSVIMHDIPELSGSADPLLVPHWARDRAQWWTEGRITDGQFLRVLHHLAGRGDAAPARAEGLEGLLLTEDEILGVTGETRWRILSTERDFEEGAAESVRITLTDITRVYDPVFYKFRIPSLVMQAVQFDGPDGLDAYWGTFDSGPYMSADAGGARCVFDYTPDGAMTSCRHGDAAFHVSIYDEHAVHYHYDREGVSPDVTEPTTRFAGMMLARLVGGLGAPLHGLLEAGADDPAPAAPVPAEPGSAAPEGSPVSGVSGLSCTRDDFGLVTVSGAYNNGGVARERAELVVSFLDRDGGVVGRTGATLHDLAEFESKRFLGHAKWDVAFAGCRAGLQ